MLRMSQNKVGNTILARMGRGCGLQLAVVAVAIPLLLVCTGTGLVLDLALGLNGMGVVLGLLLWAPTMLLGAIGVAAFIMLRRGNNLDAAFEPYGMSGSMYMLSGRQFHGTYNGWEVEAYFYRGPIFEIAINLPLHTRLTVVTKTKTGTALSGALNVEPLYVGDSAWDDNYLMRAPDADWARRFLSDSTIRSALLQILPDEGPLEIRTFIVQPNKLVFRLNNTHTSRITPENVGLWLQQFTAVASAARELPEPMARLEPNSLESIRTQSLGGRPFWIIILVIAIGVPAIAILCGLLMTVVLLAAGG